VSYFEIRDWNLAQLYDDVVVVGRRLRGLGWAPFVRDNDDHDDDGDAPRPRMRARVRARSQRATLAVIFISRRLHHVRGRPGPRFLRHHAPLLYHRLK